MVATTSADDEHLRIKIPNPIPKIAAGIRRVGVRVGNIVVRTAERIDRDAEREEVRTELVPLDVAPVPPLAPGSDVEYRRTPLPSDGVQVVVPRNPLPLVQVDPAGGRIASPTLYVPAEARRSTDSSAQKIHEAAYPPVPPSTALPPSVTVATSAARERPTAADTAEKPVPPPEHPYGKPAPGRPGLVYPPGMKELPENLVDVRGIAPGTRVRDPVTKMVFRVP